MKPEQERQLIEQARTDINAFGELYEEYYSRIFSYILKRSAAVVPAQDITSEVFLKALKNIHRFRWRDIPFSAWLYRIANNEIANFYRKNGHYHQDIDKVVNSVSYAEPSSESEILAAEAELQKYEDFLLLHQSIKALSVKYQEVITLRFFERKPLKEIADILGKSEGTVKSLLHRGLVHLRKMMNQNATF